jgi:hypothetical protein
LVIPTQSLASNGLFFNYTSSSKLVTDIKYFNTNYPLLEKKYDTCIEQVEVSNVYTANVETLLDGCNEDKKIYEDISAQLQKHYLSCNLELNKCRDATPSRFTWFSIGALSAVVGVVGMFILIK